MSRIPNHHIIQILTWKKVQSGPTFPAWRRPTRRVRHLETRGVKTFNWIICISTRNTLQGYNKHHIRLNSRTNCRVPHVLSLTPYTKPSMRITHSTIPRFQPWSQDNRHWPWLFIRVIAITHERPILSQPSCLLNFWNGGGVNCHKRFEANFTLFSQCKHLRIPYWAHTLQPFLYFLKWSVLQ